MVQLPRACIGAGGGQGCSAYAIPGTSRCLAHTPASSSGWAKYAQKYPEQAAYYRSGAWRERRAWQLREHPDCAICGEPANHVDHVVNLASGGTLDGPLQSLCRKHHRAKTQNESKAGNRRAAAARRRKR